MQRALRDQAFREQALRHEATARRAHRQGFGSVVPPGSAVSGRRAVRRRRAIGSLRWGGGEPDMGATRAHPRWLRLLDARRVAGRGDRLQRRSMQAPRSGSAPCLRCLCGPRLGEVARRHAHRVPAHLPTNTGGTLGQWWKSGYRSAWASLQQALAARYDSNPVLREVAVSSCTTLTAEPFVMAPATIALATADGWTTAAQQACLDGAFKDYGPWMRTAIYYPMNPLSGSMTVTDEVMQRCASSSTSGGPSCVLPIMPSAQCRRRPVEVVRLRPDGLYSGPPRRASRRSPSR